MKASELIDRLIQLRRENGDMDVYLDIDCHGLVGIGEVDVDADDTGIIIWAPDEEEAA